MTKAITTGLVTITALFGLVFALLWFMDDPVARHKIESTKVSALEEQNRFKVTVTDP